MTKATLLKEDLIGGLITASEGWYVSYCYGKGHGGTQSLAGAVAGSYILIHRPGESLRHGLLKS